jgi:hypothetical protein
MFAKGIIKKETIAHNKHSGRMQYTTCNGLCQYLFGLFSLSFSQLPILYQPCKGLEMRVSPQIVEEDGLEIALGSAGEDGDDDFARVFWFGSFRDCGPRCSAT